MRRAFSHPQTPPPSETEFRSLVRSQVQLGTESVPGNKNKFKNKNKSGSSLAF
jgi:hypothetical protein